jgi:hypothetical protein
MISETKRSIWLESFDDLVDRWRDLEDTTHANLPSTDKIAERVRRRVGLLLRHCDVPKLDRYDHRLWSTKHDAIAEEKRLRAAMARFGWNAVLTDGTAAEHMALVQPASIEANVAVIHREDAEALAEQIRSLDIPLDFTFIDAVLLLLAEELFQVASRDLGEAPKDPWVDELALPLFTQYILAWPFCPLARTILLARGN